MKIAVFGLGYVGCVSAACLAARGHQVVGVDTNPLKIRLLENGETPVLEPGLAELVSDAVGRGRLTSTDDATAAIAQAELSLVCVGTPSGAGGGLSTSGLERVAENIGRGLRETESFHTVVIRSTTVPGTVEAFVLPRLEEASGRRAGRDFGLCANPEFLREGSSVADFEDPPKTVIGELDARSGDAVATLYSNVRAPCFRVPLRMAELVKYVDNAWHALKIGFANEVGTICRDLDIDSRELMRTFCSDRKLNISTAYLSPGFAFGGSCLPKDLRALLHASRHADLDLPILESILPSNERQLERAVELVTSTGERRVGLFGLAFKPGTDDLRESPLVELAERLLGKGFDLRIYDPAVSLARLVGGNREYIERRIPHLSALMAESADEVARHAGVCVVGSSNPEVVEALSRAQAAFVIDLVRLPDAWERRGRDGYVGVAW
ncbi:nucleotide sugar dehydrogenase [soil metagenome]